jgi:DNA-binding XRE family transcriptional regulator
MTPEDYKKEREARGSQETVARALGVHRVTIAKRETGKQAITREAWLALLSLTPAP